MRNFPSLESEVDIKCLGNFHAVPNGYLHSGMIDLVGVHLTETVVVSV